MTQNVTQWDGDIAWLGGNTAQNDAYTGPPGTISIDTVKPAIRVHDGTTAGGSEVGGGNVSAVIQWQASTVTQFGSYSENQAVNLTVHAVSAYNLPIAYSIISGSLPPGVSLNTTTGALTGTIGNLIGNTTYTFTVQAVDTINTVTRTFSMSVTAVNQAPTWNTTSIGTVTTDTISIQLSATDPENQALTYSLLTGSLPAGVTLSSSGLINGTNPKNNSTYTFTANVSDGVNSTSQAFTMTCMNAAGEVTFATPGTYTWTVPAGVTSIDALVVDGGSVSTLAIGSTLDISPDVGYRTMQKMTNLANMSYTHVTSDGHSTIMFGTIYAVLYHSADNGLSWVGPYDQNFTQIQGNVMVAECFNGIYLIGTDAGDVYKSAPTNGGLTPANPTSWTRVANLNAQVNGIAYAAGNYLFACQDGNIYESSDDLLTFPQVSHTGYPVMGVVYDDLHARVIWWTGDPSGSLLYSSQVTGKGYVLSLDAGVNFTTKLGIDAGTITNVIIGGGKLLIVTNNGTVAFCDLTSNPIASSNWSRPVTTPNYLRRNGVIWSTTANCFIALDSVAGYIYYATDPSAWDLTNHRYVADIYQPVLIRELNGALFFGGNTAFTVATIQSGFTNGSPHLRSGNNSATIINKSATTGLNGFDLFTPNSSGAYGRTSGYAAYQNNITVTPGGTVNITVGKTDGAIRIIWGSGRSFPNGAAPVTALSGEAVFTSPGTYQWSCPAGVTSVSAVVVGAGGSYHGTGGGLAWKNNIPVVPGQTYTISVGNLGNASTSYTGQESSFIDSNIVSARGGSSSGYLGGTFTGDGGGNGGTTAGNFASGGGAGGYNGAGGGGVGYGGAANSGAGGGGYDGQIIDGQGGGGVGLYGIGTTAPHRATPGPGYGGSGGTDGNGVNGGLYGGGGGIGPGGHGAVRIIWGTNRSFPTLAS